MKFSRLLFLPFTLMGCSGISPVKIVDDRPVAELSLIKKFHIADSLVSAEGNEIKKIEVIDKQKVELIKFINDSLTTGIKQWQAYVYNIEVESWPIDNINVNLLVPQNKYLDEDEKYPLYSNMILSSTVSLSDSSIKAPLKELLKGDRVLVTGSFEKNETGKIEISSNMDIDKHGYLFKNPKFRFKIESISKQKR